MQSKLYSVYIMTNKPHGVLYVGMTSNLSRRMWQHKTGYYHGFTWRYNLHHLVYVEHHHDVWEAIRRERRLKHWPRRWKVDLIKSMNPEWRDLSDCWEL
jgi:putative endonuclease